MPSIGDPLHPGDTSSGSLDGGLIGADLSSVDLTSRDVSSSTGERADAARNRRLLLDAAARLIDAHGAAGVTMDALAREAGVGKGTVFRRFGSRAGLMRALLDHSESELQRAFLSGPPPLGPGADPLDRLLAYGHARLRLNASHLDILVEAVGNSPQPLQHPVWQTSTTHVRMLLRKLGYDRNSVAALAIQAPFEATALAHLTAAAGLDIATIAAEWEAMVRALVA